MTKPTPPIVMVVWEDATLLDTGPWTDAKEHDYKPQVFTSVGFLLYEGKEGIVLTSSMNENLVAARDQIPRGMIRKLTKLKA